MVKFLQCFLSRQTKIQSGKPEGKTVLYTLDDAYDYFLHKERGFLSDFEMNKVFFDDFCRVGYIRRGVNGNMQERWQITDFGKSQFQAYLALSEQKKKSEQLIASLAV